MEVSLETERATPKAEESGARKLLEAFRTVECGNRERTLEVFHKKPSYRVSCRNTLSPLSLLSDVL